MVSVNLGFNFHQLREKVRREIGKRIVDLEISTHPLDSAWLLYALSLDGRENNPIFEQYMNLLEKWALSEEAGKKKRDMAPLSICGFLTTKSEIKETIVKKVKELLEDVFPKVSTRFNILNDPEQVFCVSLLLKNYDDLKKQIIDTIKKNFKGRTSRKVLFIAALIELGENPEDMISELKSPESIEDVISVLWLHERYRNIINGDLFKIWKSFDSIYPNIDLEHTEEGSVLSNRDLTLLYEAVLKEIAKPDPEMLFDLYPVHPEIKKIAYEHFKHKKYVTAVFEVTKKLNEFIQHKTGIRDKNEAELVQATMKQIRNLENLIIQFNEFLSEDSGKNEQKGLALITEGIFNAFRNPKGHKPEDHPLVEITPYEALAQLIIIDYIWKRIESAKINVKGGKHA